LQEATPWGIRMQKEIITNQHTNNNNNKFVKKGKAFVFYL